jgi:hypothetical protein
MKCLNCGLENVTEPLVIEDDGAYPTGNHKVTTHQGRWKKSNAPSSRLPARAVSTAATRQCLPKTHQRYLSSNRSQSPACP